MEGRLGGLPGGQEGRDGGIATNFGRGDSQVTEAGVSVSSRFDIVSTKRRSSKHRDIVTLSSRGSPKRPKSNASRRRSGLHRFHSLRPSQDIFFMSLCGRQAAGSAEGTTTKANAAAEPGGRPDANGPRAGRESATQAYQQGLCHCRISFTRPPQGNRRLEQRPIVLRHSTTRAHDHDANPNCARQKKGSLREQGSSLRRHFRGH